MPGMPVVQLEMCHRNKRRALADKVDTLSGGRPTLALAANTCADFVDREWQSSKHLLQSKQYVTVCP